jgi:hypothetical protein
MAKQIGYGNVIIYTFYCNQMMAAFASASKRTATCRRSPASGGQGLVRGNRSGCFIS